MALTQAARKYLNFGPQGGGLDGFTATSDLRMAVGSGGADESWTSLESQLATQTTVSSVYETVPYATGNLLAQITRYRASFASLTAGEISEVGLYHKDGTFLFIESLKMGNRQVVIKPDYATESVWVEIILVRLTNREPVTLLDNEEFTVILPGLLQGGKNPFAETNPDKGRFVYRTGELEALQVYPSEVPTDIQITVDGNDILYVVELVLNPSDAFYDPFPLDTFYEIRFGTSNVNTPGIVQVKWKEVQTRPVDHTWKLRIPIKFSVAELGDGL